MKRDLAWAKAKVSRKLDFNPNQTDEAFSNDIVEDLLNEAYDEDVNWAKMHGSRLYFLQNIEFTWPASQVTYDLSATPALENLDLYQFLDVTDRPNNPQEVVLPWRDRDTLAWYSSQGPGTARTIRARYLAHAEDLTSDAQEPLLIPPAHRWLWVTTAVILGRGEADDGMSAWWANRQMNLRMAWQKEIQAKVRANYSGIEDQNDEIFNGLEQSRFSRFYYTS